MNKEVGLWYLSNYREAELLKIVKWCTDMKQEVLYSHITIS